MNGKRHGTTQTLSLSLGIAVALACGLWTTQPTLAQGPGTDNSEWTYLGGDAWHTRYSRPIKSLLKTLKI